MQTWAVFLRSPRTAEELKLPRGEQSGVGAKVEGGRFRWDSRLTIFRDSMGDDDSCLVRWLGCWAQGLQCWNLLRPSWSTVPR